MDQHTGYVKALVGGRGTKTVNRAFNRATEAERQPGSTFKIVAAYAPLIDSGKAGLATSFNDEPYQYAMVMRFGMPVADIADIVRSVRVSQAPLTSVR